MALKHLALQAFAMYDLKLYYYSYKVYICLGYAVIILNQIMSQMSQFISKYIKYLLFGQNISQWETSSI